MTDLLEVHVWDNFDGLQNIAGLSDFSLVIQLDHHKSERFHYRDNQRVQE